MIVENEKKKKKSLFRRLRIRGIKVKQLYAELAFILGIANTLMLIRLSFNLGLLSFVIMIISVIGSLILLAPMWWKSEVKADIEERLKINPHHDLQLQQSKDLKSIKEYLGIQD